MQNHVIKANSRLRKSMPTDHDDLKAEGQQSRYRAKNDSSRIEPIRSDSCRVGPNRVDSTSIRAESRRFGFVDPPPYLTPLLAPPPPKERIHKTSDSKFFQCVTIRPGSVLCRFMLPVNQKSIEKIYIMCENKSSDSNLAGAYE